MSNLKTRIILIATLLMSFSSSFAQSLTDPLDGKPSAGSKALVADLDYQEKCQRAFEAVIWSISAVFVFGWFKGAKALGTGNNTLLAWSELAKPNLRFTFI